MKNIKVLKENYGQEISSDTFVAIIDGANCTNFKLMYEEFTKKLKFPDHFGENLDALYDMLCDLEWIAESGFENVHIVIKDYDEMLINEEKDEKLGFLSVLRDSAEEWHWLEVEEKALDFTLFIEPSKTYKKDLKEI